MVVPLLIVLFIVVPLAELFVLIQVGQAIGALPTIAILVVDSILGSLLLRSQGRAAWQRFNEALRDRRPPAKEVVDGGLIIFGGALLLTPGFLTDLLGVLLLLPPSRALVRRALVRWFGRRLLVTYAGAGPPPMGPGRGRRGRRPAPGRAGSRSYDVDGEAVDLDVPPLPPSR